MCPGAQSDGHDGPGLRLEPDPGIAAVIDEGVGVVEDAAGHPVVANELPVVFLRV
jgi:hypothetical protein